jgi:PAS domain S-box-containing protein
MTINYWSGFSTVGMLLQTSLPLVLTLILFLLAAVAMIISLLIRLRDAHAKIDSLNIHGQNIPKSAEKEHNQLAAVPGQSKKDAFASDKFYEMLVQSANDGISFYDRSWNLRYTNSAFYSMIGYTRESYNMVSPPDLVHPDDQDYTLRREQALVNNGFFESELRVRHKDGHYMSLSTRSVIVRDDMGEVLGALTISRDITRLKQVHEDLIKANIGAEASNRLKSNFLANISHEIRTPLNSVVGFSNLLLTDNLPNDIKEEYIEHINHNSEKLLQIIGDIIDLSRLESSQIEITYEETSINSIVNEIIEEARQVIKRNEKPIVLTINNQFENQGDMIFTDRVWLKRVLNHLMDNAIKFTLEGSVEFSYLLENSSILFSIRDTGIGIHKENLSHIFEEFRQEFDGHHRPFEGLGIGLTLAKEVIERMGGKIFVESEKGVGSVFSFSIPYRPAGSSRPKPTPAPTDHILASIDWSKRKCLLVDDNKDVLIYLNRILSDTGVAVLTARSGFEAIEIIRNVPDIDVVLLDMQMPEMNGIEATKEIRKIRKDIPIIAQTAFIFEDDKDIILEAGCDACLIKPIRREHLLTVMSSFVKPNGAK